jgi:hypothetical protein
VLCHQNICKLLQVRYRNFFMNCFVDIVLSIILSKAELEFIF